jgi:hypothetical protein
MKNHTSSQKATHFFYKKSKNNECQTITVGILVIIIGDEILIFELLQSTP